jgi:hypothetical protein
MKLDREPTWVEYLIVVILVGVTLPFALLYRKLFGGRT